MDGKNKLSVKQVGNEFDVVRVPHDDGVRKMKARIAAAMTGREKRTILSGNLPWAFARIGGHGEIMNYTVQVTA